MKSSDNTPFEEIDRVSKPATSTMVDRYVIANHWTKNKSVLDAATGKGYGAMILYSLGAKSVTGIDIDKEGIKDANKRFKKENVSFHDCDIFNLKQHFSDEKFDVCTSIETFEHLPPERIDEYLQSLNEVTKENIIITTPRRITEVWEYNGGTHLYEYDAEEIKNILKRNFPDDLVELIGLNEYTMPNGQFGTDFTNDLEKCRVFFAVVTKKNG